MYCTQCGNEIGDNQFCTGCGAAMRKRNVVPRATRERPTRQAQGPRRNKRVGSSRLVLITAAILLLLGGGVAGVFLGSAGHPPVARGNASVPAKAQQVSLVLTHKVIVKGFQESKLAFAGVIASTPVIRSSLAKGIGCSRRSGLSTYRKSTGREPSSQSFVIMLAGFECKTSSQAERNYVHLTERYLPHLYWQTVRARKVGDESDFAETTRIGQLESGIDEPSLIEVWRKGSIVSLVLEIGSEAHAWVNLVIQLGDSVVWR